MNNKNKICLYIMIIVIAFISIAHITVAIRTNYENNKTIEENQKIVEEYKNKLEENRIKNSSKLKGIKKDAEIDNIQVEIEQIIQNCKSKMINNGREIKYSFILSLICVLPLLIYKLIVKLAEIDDSYSSFTSKILAIDSVVSISLFIYDVISRLSDIGKFNDLLNTYKQLLVIISEISIVFG